MSNMLPKLKSVYRSRAFKALAIVLSLLVATTGAYYIIYYNPLNQQYVELNTDLQRLRVQLLSLKSLNNASENLQSLLVNVEKINQKLSYPVDSIQLNKFILELSKRNKIRINRQKHSEISRSEKRKIFKQDLNIQGNYHQIRDFINNIYQLPSLTVIESASFQKKSTADRTLSVTITLLTYQSKGAG